MTKVVNVHEAKTHLSRLLERVQEGEEIILAKAGKPVARLVPISSKSERIPGTAGKRVRIGKDFFDPLPESVLREFYK